MNREETLAFAGELLDAGVPVVVCKPRAGRRRRGAGGRVADHHQRLAVPGHAGPVRARQGRAGPDRGLRDLVCILHDQNSRHVDSDDPHRPCLEVDPYPEEQHAT